MHEAKKTPTTIHRKRSDRKNTHVPETDGTLTLLRDCILSRKGIVGCGKDYTAALSPDGGLLFTGASRCGQEGAAAWQSLLYVACGPDYLLGMTRDGSVHMCGHDLDDGSLRVGAEAWVCVRALSCGARHAAALLTNRQVSCVGDSSGGRCATEGWRDIVDVVCGNHFTVGLNERGDVLVAGDHRLAHRLSHWHEIAGIFIDAQGKHVYGLTADGHLLSSRPLPRVARRWSGLVSVAATGGGIWGVTMDGRLLSAHPGKAYLPTDIALVACGAAHAVTVSRGGDCASVGAYVRNGRVMDRIASGAHDFGQSAVDGWDALFADFDAFAMQRKKALDRLTDAERQYQLRLTGARRFSRRLACGERLTACISADGRVLTTGNFREVRDWKNVVDVSCGLSHILALHGDGHVSAAGNSVSGCCDVDGWTGVRQVLAKKYHSLALTEDGRVLFAGLNEYGQGNVSDWRGIRLLCASDTATCGIDVRGEIHVTGMWQGGIEPLSVPNLDGGWEKEGRFTDLQLTEHLLVGLRQDGSVTILAAHQTESCAEELYRVNGWRDVRAISVGDGFVVGLCYGGRVLAAGRNDRGQCDVASWRHIVAVACGNAHTVGLCADGTVCSTGMQRNGEERRGGSIDMGGAVMAWERTAFTGYTPCDTRGWNDVIALACGPEHTVALNEKGRVLATGLDLDRQCAGAKGFVLFRDIRQYDGFGCFGAQIEEELQKKRNGQNAGTETDADADGADSLPSSPDAAGWEAVFAALYADADRLAARVSGSADGVTLLDAQGRLLSYSLSGEMRTAIQPSTVLPELTEGRDGTLLLDREGKAYALPHTADPVLTDLSAQYRLPGRVTAVRAGEAHIAFLLEDGTVTSVGDHADGACDTQNWKGVTQLFTGDRHTAALCADGSVLTTQKNRIGDADFLSYNRRSGVGFRVSGPMARFALLTCAGDMTAGLCFDGRVQAWGDNRYGQCGTDGWTSVRCIAASGRHTLGLRADGRVLACGCDKDGECAVAHWRRVIRIIALPGVSLGLCADGRVLSAGRYRSAFSALRGVRSVAAVGASAVAVIFNDGGVRLFAGGVWVSAPEGGLRLFTPGVADSIIGRILPGVPFRDGVRTLRQSFGCGFAHTARVICEDMSPEHPSVRGRVFASGSDHCGQCETAPWARVTALACGLNHTAAVSTEGEILAVGQNRSGQCDVERLNANLLSVGAPEGAGRFVSVACGYRHTAALRGDGRVFTIGDHAGDEGCGCCDTTAWRDVVSLACGVRQTAAVSADGTCLFAGDGSAGQGKVGAWSGLVTVACGEFHTVGLREDGTLVAAGRDGRGPCDVGDLRGVISVTCLPEATVCVLADGTVTVRGGDSALAAAVAPIRDAVAVDGCENRLAVLTVDRRLLVFGGTPGADV